MPLTETQRRLVEDNMGLVGAVIKDNVRNVNSIGIFTYQDIFQIGCLGLIKAAEKHTPGGASFCTCAYAYIRNEIFNALDYATVRRRKESIAGIGDVLGFMQERDDFSGIPCGLDDLIEAAKARAAGVVAKGIDAIRLMADGYTCREIGELMGGASANNVTAWVSRARAYLKSEPDIKALWDAL